MSKMTKFLKQTCSIQAYATSEGEPTYNEFGELIYGSGVTCSCRCEPLVRDLLTSNGSVLKTTSRYFLDESVDVKTDYLIDGHVVLSVETYINQVGKVEGYEVYT